MPVEFQRTTLRYIPEDRTLHNHLCENLKFYIIQSEQQRRLRGVEHNLALNWELRNEAYVCPLTLSGKEMS
jgi:hypothetical protein